MPIVGNIYDTEKERQMMVDCLERIKERIKAEIDSHGLRASGRTQDSLEVIDQVTSVQLVGRQYFQSVEIGRPAGRVPRDFHDIIRQWILDKGIQVTPIPYKTDRPHKYTVEERSMNAAVGAICHSIQTRGTTLYRNGGDPTVYTPAINEEIEVLKNDLKVEITKLIYNIYDPKTGLKKE